CCLCPPLPPSFPTRRSSDLTWDRSAPLCQAARDAQILLPSNARIDAEVVAAPRDLRLIQQPAAGIDNVDLTAARERGVPVCNTRSEEHTSELQSRENLVCRL